jgi:preprotein translocase subunit SecB
MSEEDNQRQFSIQRLYTKDISFETPNSPQIFTDEWQPSLNVEITTKAQDLGNNHYELVLNLTVTAKQEDKVGFLAEIQQAGIFLIAGLNQEEMGPMLGIVCPNILFPYAREVVSDLVNRGSFPQLVLAPVNFEGLYAQQMQQQQAEADEKAD